jgi:hypothetical protein
MKRELSIDAPDDSAPAWLYGPQDGEAGKGSVLFFMDTMGAEQLAVASDAAWQRHLVVVPIVVLHRDLSASSH